jgi:hypothetical protein
VPGFLTQGHKGTKLRGKPLTAISYQPIQSLGAPVIPPRNCAGGGARIDTARPGEGETHSMDLAWFYYRKYVLLMQGGILPHMTAKPLLKKTYMPPVTANGGSIN